MEYQDKVVIVTGGGRGIGQSIALAYAKAGAKACLYLTGPDNDFITGTNLVIDGGMTRKMIYQP